MKISKDQARKALETYISEHCDVCEGISLPINDAMVCRSAINNVIHDYSFRYLLMIAYELKEYGSTNR